MSSPALETLEVQALPDMDELTTVQRPILDPWHRLSAISDDLILLTEFSESEGPRPALCVKASSNCHFDRDAFAIWLMTSDYQRQTFKASSSSDHRTASNRHHRVGLDESDAQVMLHNAEQGVFAFAQQFTLYELRARAFVRPFCLSYVSKDRRKLAALFEELQNDFSRTLIQPLKACNRRLFYNELKEALKILDAVENQTISSYYELCYTGASAADDRRTEQELKLHLDTDEGGHSRHRHLHNDIYNACKSLEMDMGAEGAGRFPCSEEHGVNMQAWIECLNMKASSKARPPLRYLSTLAPCAFSEFEKACQRTLNKYHEWSPLLPYHLVTHLQGSCCLRIGSFPMLFYPKDGVSGQPRCVVNKCTALRTLAKWKNKPDGDEKRMASVYSTPRLSSLLYSLLIGKFVLLVGSDLRQKSVVSFVNALKNFVPTHCVDAPVRPWSRGDFSSTALFDYKIYGMHVAKSAKAETVITGNVAPLISLVDLNRDVLCAPEYRGVMLGPIADVAKLHRCDWSFVTYALVVLSDYCSLAYALTAFLGDKSQWKSKEPKERFVQFGQRFRLEEHDLKIVRYLADLVGVQNCHDQTNVDSNAVAFDCEIAKELKL